MIENLKKCEFKYTFRDYQKRVLDEVRVHLKDGKLNIVAAPGAGKTILALSLMIELGEPVLIVAPTILLRQQWLDRLKNDFENFEGIKDIISEDIYSPDLITVTTYQALYSVYKGKSNKSKEINIVEKLKDLKIRTIILDEAHHLKTSWLDATKSLIDKLENVVTISLTATPPYDIDKFLWNKYINLCGEVDAEISVPELVKTRDLAPHQDYIYFNYPSNVQIEEMNQYTVKVQEFFEKYSTSYDLVMAVSMHEGIIDLESKLEYFIENFEYYDAMISFLRFNNIDIPENNYFKYDYKACKFDINKLQILLNYCLYNDRKSYSAFEGLFRSISRNLNKIGAIYERKVDLFYSNEIKTTITQNVGKMDSVKAILEFEKESLKEKLKAVIITENIYKELLTENDDYDTKYMGVIPLFRYLSKNTKLKYVVLTGEIIILPGEYKEELIEISKSHNILEEDILINDLSFNFDYCRVNFEGNASKNRVLVITELFEKVEVEALIGTNALIGEGWDAPFINTLIMATPVSAYVSANQIRGRVIRKYKKDPNKFANIWHLVCVEKTATGFKYGYDYENLIRRFDAFEGINVEGNNISYGISRLNLPDAEYESIEKLNELNQNILDYAYNRYEISKQWFRVLENYRPVRKNRVGTIEIVENFDNENIEKIEKSLLKVIERKGKKLKNNSNNIALFIILAFSGGFLYALSDAIKISFETGDIYKSTFSELMPLIVLITTLIMSIVGLIIENLPIFNARLKNRKMNRHNRLINRFIQAIHKTLVYINVIDKNSKLIVEQVEGNLEYYLDNSTLRENELLKNSVNEIMSKLDDARYVLKINDFYFPVPELIGRKNEYVKYFNSYFGGEVIYLKSSEGKRKLFNIKLLQNNLVNRIVENDKNVQEKNNKISEDMRNMKIMGREFEKN